MRRVQILLTKRKFDYLKELSDDTGESMASIIRRAIERMKTDRPAASPEWKGAQDQAGRTA